MRDESYYQRVTDPTTVRAKNADTANHNFHILEMEKYKCQIPKVNTGTHY